jgi:hypothetical protein
VTPGLKGFVRFVDELSGLAEILIEGYEPALYNWDNLLVIVPFETEDLTSLFVASVPWLRSVNPSEFTAQLAAY